MAIEKVKEYFDKHRLLVVSRVVSLRRFRSWWTVRPS